MYEENPGEIDFGSSLCEVRVSKVLSYRESTVKVKCGKVVNSVRIFSFLKLGFTEIFLLVKSYWFWSCL